MTRQHAKRILDAARAGEDVSEAQITAALVASGDIDAIDPPIRQECLPAGSWELSNAGSMARATWVDGLGAAA